MATELRTVDTKRGQVQYIDSGGDGPPVFFIHGAPGGCDQGELMGRFLADAGFRVVAPSRPGYLETPLGEGNADPAQQAALHAALADTLGITRFAVVCWSGGGPSSYQLAIDEPDRVSALVGIAAVAKPYTFEHPSEELFLFGRAGAWLMKELGKHAPTSLIKSMVAEEGQLDKPLAKELVSNIATDDDKRDWILAWVDTVTGHRKSGFNNDRKQLPALDLDLEAVRAPVLLVHADTDSDVPFEYSEDAVNRLTEAELHTIPNGTHVSTWTGPDEVQTQSRIVAFLRAHP